MSHWEIEDLQNTYPWSLYLKNERKPQSYQTQTIEADPPFEDNLQYLDLVQRSPTQSMVGTISSLETSIKHKTSQQIRNDEAFQQDPHSSIIQFSQTSGRENDAALCDTLDQPLLAQVLQSEIGVPRRQPVSGVYVCHDQECGGRSFQRKTEWTKHVKKHEKPFKCPADRCSGAFARNSDLRRHDQSVHKRELKFWCTVSSCLEKDVAFARRDHFIQHLATHSSPTAPNAQDAKLGALASSTPTRKRRRRLRSNEEDGGLYETDVKDEVMKLRAEVEMLRLRAEKLQDTVYIQAGSIHALLSRTI